MSSLCPHLHVLSFGRLIFVLAAGRQRAGRPPAALGSLLAARGAPPAEGPAQRHGPARTAAGHLHRGGVGVVLAWLRAGALAARLQRHLFILLSLVTVLHGRRKAQSQDDEVLRLAFTRSSSLQVNKTLCENSKTTKRKKRNTFLRFVLLKSIYKLFDKR